MPSATSDVDPVAAPRPGFDFGLVALHDHLDGGLRSRTLAEWAVEDGRAADVDAAEAAIRRGDAQGLRAESLEAYLARFAPVIDAMGSPARLRRTAREAVEDVRADGVVLAEFRMAPDLWLDRGLSPEAVIEAVLEGLAEGIEATAADPSPFACGLIVCALRHLDEARVAAVADLALATHRRDAAREGPRVLGFDLAGAERGHAPARHGRALARLHEAGVPLTLHAGEADTGERVLEAVAAGARRIGHGIQIMELLAGPRRAEVVERLGGVHFEVCPSSNVHTGAVPALAAHPIAAMRAAGIDVGVNVDNRLISRTTASAETALLAGLGLDPAAVRAMHAAAARASFLGERAIARALPLIETGHPPSSPS